MKNHYLITNGTVARDYLARRIVVPSSLRTKDAAYTDLSNVAGDRLVLLNDPITTPQLRDSVLFSGWNDHGVSLEARAQVLIELPLQEKVTVSPNNYFSVLESQVIAMGSQVKLYVADAVTRDAYLDFLNRFDDFDTNGISVEISDGLSNGEDTEETTMDLKWLKSLPRAKPPAKSQFERMERIACAILVMVHHAVSTVQRDSVAALFVDRPIPKGVLGSIVEHRQDAKMPKDPVFMKIADLVLSANLVGDAKAAARENGWVAEIRKTLSLNEKVGWRILDDIEAFLDNNILWHKIKDLDKHPALQSFVLFLRDSGQLPKFVDADSNIDLSDAELASCYLSGLFHLRSQLSLEYRRPIEAEALIAALVSSSINNKRPSLEFSSSDYKVIFEDGVLMVAGQRIVPRAIPMSDKKRVSDPPSQGASSTAKVDTWEIMTSKKVVLEIDGLKQTFSPSTVLKFSFLEEPVVKKHTRDGPSTVNTEPPMTDASNSRSVGNREKNQTLFDPEPPEPTF